MTPFQWLTWVVMRSFPLRYGDHHLRNHLAGVPEGRDLWTQKLRGYPLKITFKPKTYMGWFLFYRGVYEEIPLATCYSLLEPGMTFADIGANQGLYSLVAAHKVTGTGKVLAFEPQSALISIIRQNITQNSLDNVLLHNIAIGDRCETLTLYQPSATNDGQATLRLLEGEKFFGTPEEVAVRPLPDVLAEEKITRLDGMKIDVEGAEWMVLKGMEPLLARREPEFLLIECIDGHLKRFGHSCAEVFTLLQDHGYRLASLKRGKWLQFNNDEEFRLKTTSSSDVLAVHPETATWEKAKRIFR